MQACSAGCRDERQSQTDGGCGRRLGGRRTTQGEEVGSGCYKERGDTSMNATDGGAVGGRREIVRSRKWLRQVGRAGLD